MMWLDGFTILFMVIVIIKFPFLPLQIPAGARVQVNYVQSHLNDRRVGGGGGTMDGSTVYLFI